MLKQLLKGKVWSAFLLSKRRPDLFVFCLLLVLLPTQLGLHFWPDWALVAGIRVDYLSPTIYLTDLLVAGLLTIWSFKINFQKQYLLVVLFAVLNIVFAISWKVSLYKWLKVLEFGLLAHWVYQNKKFVKKHIGILLTIALSYILFLTVWQFSQGRTIGGLFYFLGERSFSIQTPGIALVNIFEKNFLRPYATFSHPNALGGFGLAAFFLGSPLGLPLVLLSFSQGAWIAGVLVLLAKKLVVHIYAQILLGLVLISILLMPLGSMITESKRLMLASVAGEAFARSPLVGVGLGNFTPFIPISLSQNSLWFLQPVHNIFLLVLSETGAIGLLLFCYLIIKLLKNSLKIENGLLIILSILLTGMADHYWLTLQQTQLLFSIVIGLIL